MQRVVPMLVFAVSGFFVVGSVQPLAAQVSFTSSNLPIVIIDTDGEDIRNEPKITAQMGIIDNGPGATNQVTDVPNDYDGFIGIERRGASSQALYPKKQYSIETREADGEDLNVKLLGFPKESDWVLYAPYGDKSLMRNVLTYRLARRMGRYASRTRFCEVVLNGTYQGVFVLMEKIKRDDDRVDISKLNPDETSGDDLTGGYIIKIDKQNGSEVEGWTSGYPAAYAPDKDVRYQYHDPEPSELVEEQKTYIQNYIAAFEDAMAASTFEDPDVGYPAFIDLDSFVDFFIVNELGKNVDSYRLSTYLYKDKDSNDGALHAGPVWDFNLAFGNADYYDGADVEGFQYDFAQTGDDFPIPFWWKKLAESEGFREALGNRWVELRQGVLHEDSLMQSIDAMATLLDEAQARNFERWPILGEYIWPNVFVGQTYAEEIDYLKGWLSGRVAWLDANLPGATTVANEPRADVPEGYTTAVYPNPLHDRAQFTLTLAQPQRVSVAVYDLLGRRVARLHDGTLAAGRTHTFAFEAGTLPAGLYLVRAEGTSFSASRRVVVLRH